jgi:hypothetical protein
MNSQKRTPKMKAYFRGRVNECEGNEGLHFERKGPDLYWYWSDANHMAVNAALYHYARRYAERRSVPVYTD